MEANKILQDLKEDIELLSFSLGDKSKLNKFDIKILRSLKHNVDVVLNSLNQNKTKQHTSMTHKERMMSSKNEKMEHEYNHQFEQYLQEQFYNIDVINVKNNVNDVDDMLIKVKYAPDTELLGDIGTCYIVTAHKGFIKTLESITDYKVMPHFLDANKEYYKELIETPEHYDKEIDLSEQCLKNIQDDSMPFKDKQICSFVDIPKVEV